MRGWLEVLQNAPLILVNTLLALGLLEGAARTAEWMRPLSEDVAFEYAPYRMLRMSRAPWPLNREGFRAQELDRYRGKFVVEFLGGSVCLGVGNNPGKSVPERLEEALHAAGMKRAAVLNLCQGGASSAQELAIFLEYGLPLAPQVVLSFNGANDLMHPLPLGEDAAPNLPYRDREMRAGFAGQHSWTAHLAAARVVAKLAGRPKRAAAARQVVDPEAILESYLYATGVVRTLTRERGGWHAVLLQPALHYSKPWSEAETAMWHARRPEDGEEVSLYAGKLYAQARERLGGLGEFFDLTPVFAATSETVYSDSVHFTGNRGYRMLAEELDRQGLIGKIAARYKVWEAGDGSLAWRR